MKRFYALVVVLLCGLALLSMRAGASTNEVVVEKPQVAWASPCFSVVGHAEGAQRVVLEIYHVDAKRTLLCKQQQVLSEMGGFDFPIDLSRVDRGHSGPFHVELDLRAVFPYNEVISKTILLGLR